MQPNSAAQSNPAPLAGRQQAGSPLFKRTTQRTPPTGNADAGRCAVPAGGISVAGTHHATRPALSSYAFFIASPAWTAREERNTLEFCDRSMILPLTFEGLVSVSVSTPSR